MVILWICIFRSYKCLDNELKLEAIFASFNKLWFFLTKIYLLRNTEDKEKGLSAPLAQTEKVGTPVSLTWLLFLKYAKIINFLNCLPS